MNIIKLWLTVDGMNPYGLIVSIFLLAIISCSSEVDEINYNSKAVQSDSFSSREHNVSTVFENGKLMHPNSINIFTDNSNDFKIAVKDYRISFYDIDSIYKDPVLLKFSFEINIPKGLGDLSDAKTLKNSVHQSILISHILLEEDYTLRVIKQDKKAAIDSFIQNLRKQLIIRTNNSAILVNDSISASSRLYATEAEYMNEDDLKTWLMYVN